MSSKKNVCTYEGLIVAVRSGRIEDFESYGKPISDSQVRAVCEDQLEILSMRIADLSEQLAGEKDPEKRPGIEAALQKSGDDKKFWETQHGLGAISSSPAEPERPEKLSPPVHQETQPASSSSPSEPAALGPATKSAEYLDLVQKEKRGEVRPGSALNFFSAHKSEIKKEELKQSGVVLTARGNIITRQAQPAAAGSALPSKPAAPGPATKSAEYLDLVQKEKRGEVRPGSASKFFSVHKAEIKKEDLKRRRGETS